MFVSVPTGFGTSLMYQILPIYAQILLTNWIYRCCPISKLSGCVSLLISIKAEQVADGYSTQPVSLPHKCHTPASHTKSLTLNSTHVYVYMHFDYERKCYALRILYI